ncbi:MAG: DUF4416 family protein [Spirochaetes bacterium]|nr:DUF4416 family protein [Spirochaetota bacterium]
MPKPALLFAGVLTESEDLAKSAMIEMNKTFGPVDTISEPIPFLLSSYYEEIGEKLFKLFFSFTNLIERNRITDIKLFTNKLETKLSLPDNTRKINIDPGYLTLSNVCLASCKEYYHRVYLDKGVHLENEYYYTGGKFVFFDWTYPDYRKPEYLNYFMMLREKYRLMLK